MAGELVLKHWKVMGQPQPQEQPMISIEGRQPGFIAFLLNLVGLDPTTKMDISSQAVYFTGSSVRGQNVRVIPLTNVTSTYYGYEKPVELLFMAGILAISVVGLLVFWIPLVFYFLQKALTIAIVEQSGVISAIRFKSSVIEGVKVDQNECARVNALIRDLLITANRSK